MGKTLKEIPVSVYEIVPTPNENGIIEGIAKERVFRITDCLNDQEVTMLIDGKEYNVDVIDLVSALHYIAPHLFAFKSELE